MDFKTLNNLGMCSCLAITNLGGLDIYNVFDDDLTYNDFVTFAYKQLNMSNWVVDGYDMERYGYITAYTVLPAQEEAASHLEKLGFTSLPETTQTKNTHDEGATVQFHVLDVDTFIKNLKSENARITK